MSAAARTSPLALSLPVAMGYIPMGTAFGFLMMQAGAQWWMPPLASVLIFAGAAQFMMVPMLAAGDSLAAFALTTLAVNLRHIFYGLSLLHVQPKHPLARAYMMFALTDETYAVLTSLPPDTPDRTRVLLSALNHCWWITGGLLGVLLGSLVPTELSGIDFSLAALFAILAVEQWRAVRSTLPLLVAIVCYALALALWPQQALLGAIAACVLIGWYWSANGQHGAPPPSPPKEAA